VEEIVSFEPTQEYLERFRTAVDNQDEKFIRESLETVRHEDVSALLEEFNAEQSKYVLELLEKEIATDVIEDLDEDVRTKFLTAFNSEEIAEYVEEMETDDAADILNDLPVKVREEVIANLVNHEKASHIIELLRYDEDCAGGLMAKELIKANVNWNVVQCVEEIRRQAENVEKIFSVYVVDDADKLLGRVSLKEIVLAISTAKIADIYNSEVISVYTYQKDEEIADLMQKYDLEAAPVVNVQGKLLEESPLMTSSM
jgi:magnesium transporter